MKTLSQLSGGLDSVASTLLVAKSGDEFRTIFFDIDQPYMMKELMAVKYFDEWLKDRFVNYKGLKIVKADLALDSSHGPSEYIPVRNLVLGALSANQALSVGYGAVAVGSKTVEVRPDDPYSFSDCSISFYDQMGSLATFASENQLLIFTMPLVDKGIALSKKQVIELLIEEGVDVKKLWSCYGIKEEYCGVCYHCAEIKKTGYWDYFIK